MEDQASVVQARLTRVQEAAAEAARSANRDPSEVTIIGVTKRHPLRLVLLAHQVGLRQFGENQVQEALPKIEAAPDDIHWHLIGHLQKNKVRPAVKAFQTIHSVDSLKLIRRINRISGEEGQKPEILIQVNLVSDPNKFGLAPEDTSAVLDEALASEHVTCLGLMAIPPLAYSDEETRTYLADLKRLRDDLKKDRPQWPGRLSFGMSRDYLLAIEMGSHYVRVGTSIFGERS